MTLDDMRGIKHVLLTHSHLDHVAALPLMVDAIAGSITQPLFGNALWMEYQDRLGRPVWGDVTTADERHVVLAGLARQGR